MQVETVPTDAGGDKLGMEIVFGWGNRFATPTELDVHIIIGGHFAPDHLGPGPFDAIVKRVRAEPAHYTAVLERVVGKSPSTRMLSSSHIVGALEMFAKAGAKTEVTALAKKLVPHYAAALKTAVPTKNDQGIVHRLQERLDGAKRLAGLP